MGWPVSGSPRTCSPTSSSRRHVIAIPGRGLSTALASLAMGRIGVAAGMGVGMGQCAFDHASGTCGSAAPSVQTQRLPALAVPVRQYAMRCSGVSAIAVPEGRPQGRHLKAEPSQTAMAKVVGNRVAVDIAHRCHPGPRRLDSSANSPPPTGWPTTSKPSGATAKWAEIYGHNEVRLWSIARDCAQSRRDRLTCRGDANPLRQDRLHRDEMVWCSRRPPVG